MLLIFIITRFDLFFTKFEVRLFILALNRKILAKRQMAVEIKNQTRFLAFVEGLYEKTSGGSRIWFNGK